MTNPSLGIMTVHTPTYPPFPEKSFFKSLIQIGQREGIPVIVFHPNHVNFTTMMVKGYSLNDNGDWVTSTVPVPHYIYDRCFYMGGSYNRKYKLSVAKLLQDHSIHFLGIGLKGKWQMFEAVSQHPTLRQYLPPTEVFKTMDQLIQWLKRFPSIILKPINGSLGMGVVKVTQNGNTLHVEGRTRNNALIRRNFSTLQAFSVFFQSYLKSWKYLLQPYLTLRNEQDIPFDVRLLVQKDGTGQWSSTGKAIRMGLKKGITSNLHGGGRAVSFERFMLTNYTHSEVKTISNHLHTLETVLPEFLEKQIGPLVELGIDVGIDSDHNVWLIEVNSKPGREIFEQLNDHDAMLKSQSNPLYYAKYLMKNHGRLWQEVSRRVKKKRKRI